jgi:DNA/RNA-binding domain of Phe-tRNA-synthetase-like protein
MTGSDVVVACEPHPQLAAIVLVSEVPASLAECPSPTWLVELLAADASTPLTRDENVRVAIRDLLRAGGYKPTGRGKPASEYLVRAASEGTLQSINAAVDACNVVSLHSGFPISVIDTDRGRSPWRIAVAAPGTSYVFNPSGQDIDLGGLLTVFDADGPCAGPVKDSQRTKTSDATRRTMSVVWGRQDLLERLESAASWYEDLLRRLDGRTERALVKDGVSTV